MLYRIAVVVALSLSSGCADEQNAHEPSVARVVPDRGRLGERVAVQIEGAGFHVPLENDLDESSWTAGGATVSIGSVVLDDAAVRSEVLIEAGVPATLQSAAYDVRVAFSYGRGARLEDGYEVVPPMLVFSTAPQTVDAGGCSSEVTLRLEDGFGAALAADADTVIELRSDSPSLTTFTDAGCTTAATDVTLEAGNNAVALFFRETAIGSPTISAAAIGQVWTPAEQVEAVTAAVPVALAFRSAPVPTTTCGCSTAVMVEVRDIFGNAAPVGSSTAVTLTADSPSLRVFADAKCSDAARSLTIGAGEATATAHFADDSPGTPSLTAAATGLASATQVHSVAPGAMLWYADDDGDGFGDSADTATACTQPAGFVANSTDCDDDPTECGAACFPGNPATDSCDGYDQDCDADIDPGCSTCADGPCDDGVACTAGDTCLGDVCAGYNTCAGSCDASCAGGCGGDSCCVQTCPGGNCPDCQAGCSCDQLCSNPSSCTATCQPGSVCHTDSRNANDSTVTCNDAVCHYECRNDGACAMACNGSSWCEFTCLDSGDCDLQCDATASCLIQCTGSGSCNDNCAAPVSCGGGVTACNRACP